MARHGPPFDACVETLLAPELAPGDVVILPSRRLLRNQLPGNGQPVVPREPRAAQALEARGARFLSLPPHSPDPNPVGTAFSKLEAHLRRIGARTVENLWRAAGSICDLRDEREGWTCFAAMGYAHE